MTPDEFREQEREQKLQRLREITNQSSVWNWQMATEVTVLMNETRYTDGEQ